MTATRRLAAILAADTNPDGTLNFADISLVEGRLRHGFAFFALVRRQKGNPGPLTEGDKAGDCALVVAFGAV